MNAAETFPRMAAKLAALGLPAATRAQLLEAAAEDLAQGPEGPRSAAGASGWDLALGTAGAAPKPETR